MSQEQTKAIVSAVAIMIVNVANIFNLTLDTNAVTTVVLCAAALASMVWGIWKNHNFTAAAHEAQQYLDLIKNVEPRREEDDEEAEIPDDYNFEEVVIYED